MKTAALYARVSSDIQEREETIDSQIVQLRQMAVNKGYVVVDRHLYLDEGYSGDLLARPSLDRLRDDARDGLIDIVLVHCPDRLARRYAYQVVVIEELERFGCEIDFVNREIARTPEDQMLLAMQGVVAEYERAKIMERTRRGRLHKLQSGVLILPRPPFGYRWIPKQGSERGRLEIDEDQADLVRKIFNWIERDGMSIMAVTRHLMEQCVPPPRGGRRWGTSTIQKILRNRSYTGEFCMNRTKSVESKEPPKPGVYRKKRNTLVRIRPEDEWIPVAGPAIIEKDLFEAVQNKMVANKRFSMRRACNEHQLLLRCLLQCGCCGYSLMGHWTAPRGIDHKIFRYYMCTKRVSPTRYGDRDTKCTLKPLRAHGLDDAVWADLRELLSDSKKIAEYAGLGPIAKLKPLHDEVARLRREIETCDQQMQRIVDAYQKGVIDADNLQTRRKQVEGRRQIAAEALGQADTTIRDENVRKAFEAHIPALIERVKQTLESADFVTRQKLVRLLVDRIIVHANHDLEIHYVLPGPSRLASIPAPSTSAPSDDDVKSLVSKRNIKVSSVSELSPERERDLAMRRPCATESCMKDGGRPSEAALQEEASNHRKRLRSKTVVVSVTEKAQYMRQLSLTHKC